MLVAPISEKKPCWEKVGRLLLQEFFLKYLRMSFDILLKKMSYFSQVRVLTNLLIEILYIYLFAPS